MNKKQRVMLSRILAAAALLILFQFLPLTGVVRFLAYLVPYLVIGYDILLKAGKGIRNRQVFDESFLMAVATVGAIALALYERSGDYTEPLRLCSSISWRVVPELCCRKEPPEHQRADGHSP